MNKTYHCGKFPKKVCISATLGNSEIDCEKCKYTKTTIKQYFKNGGLWHVMCDMSKPYRSMTVNVGFINSENEDDETQFDINAYNSDELSDLFEVFCKENKFPHNTVQYVEVVAVMEGRR